MKAERLAELRRERDVRKAIEYLEWVRADLKAAEEAEREAREKVVEGLRFFAQLEEVAAEGGREWLRQVVARGLEAVEKEKPRRNS